MEILGDIFHSLWSFFVILSTIVFVHEFGHFIVARWCGVKIDAFSIGFGKEIWGFNDKHGTRWKLSVLPFGGYVKMYGDASAASTPDDDTLDTLSPEEKSITFHHKPLWKKSLIVAAGPAANFILCIGILTYFMYTVGMQSTEPMVGQVAPGSAAQQAGLKAGDRVLSVGGEEVESFNDIAMLVSISVGDALDVTVERSKEILHFSITPKIQEDIDALGNKYQRPLLGIVSQEITMEEVGLPRAVWEASKRTYTICTTTLKVIGQIVTGQRGPEGLKGPVGIAKLSGQATEKDSYTILWFIAMLSANLGLMNLLPVPLLDGGHLAYYVAEALRGKPLAKKVQEFGFRIGFALLAMLMAFTLYNDVVNLFTS